MKDYYQVLGISRDVSQEEIKKTFRRLALCYHPDRNLHNKEQAEEKFKEINEAYQVLGDKDKRWHYDYLTTLYQYRQGSIREDVFSDSFGQNLNEEALRQLLRQLATLGFSFGSGLGYMKGCRRGYGQRCRRW